MIDITVDTLVKQTSTSATAEVDGQLVAIDVSIGVCYGLNSVATEIWGLIRSPASAAQVSRELVKSYEVDLEVCAQQTLDLFRHLISAGLAVPEAR